LQESPKRARENPGGTQDKTALVPRCEGLAEPGG